MDEDTIVNALRKLSGADPEHIKPPPADMVSYVQASFLQALESTEGVMELQNITLEVLAIVSVLESKLLLIQVRKVGAASRCLTVVTIPGHAPKNYMRPNLFCLDVSMELSWPRR